MGEAKRKKEAEKAGIHIPDRKFLSEFAVNLFTARWLMITPEQLMSGNEMLKEHIDISKLCHIYLICKRPLQSIVPDSFKFEDDKISGSISYKIAGAERRIPFSHDFRLSDGATEISLPYPFREIRTLSPSKEIVRYMPVGALSAWGVIRDPLLQNLEVLYVGQAFGDGSRTAFDRLRNHSTLQKILADTHYSYPDDEIQILSFEYKPYRLISSFDGISKNTISDARDSSRFSNLMKRPLSEKQQICLAEAGLIRYFKPRYNYIYKDSFPSSDQVILNECYRLDFSALIVEINTDDLNFSLYSDETKANQHHIAKFDLVDSKVRRSFFTFVGSDGKAIDMPGVIGRS